jgi:hypothetical protein
MSALRPQHWFWLAAVCLAATLGLLWSYDDVQLAEPAAETADPNPAASGILRHAQQEAPRPLSAPVVPHSLLAPDLPFAGPRNVAPADVAAVLQSDFDEIARRTKSKKVVPAAFAGDRKQEVPTAVWLSGGIEPADSGN